MRLPRFFRNVFTLLSGSAVAQGLNYAVFLWLALLYSPEAFGLYAFYTATMALVAEVVNGRYELALMLPKSETRSRLLLALCLLIAGAVTLLGSFVVAFIDWQVLTGKALAGSYFFYLPLSFLLLGITQPLSIFLNRLQLYTSLAVAKVLQVLALGSISIAFGYMGAPAIGLLWGLLAGQLVQGLFLLIVFLAKSKKPFQLSWQELREVAVEYSYFPRYSIPSAFLNVASRQSPIYLLGYFFGTAVAGQYSLAFKLLTAPVMLLANSYGQVFYERAVKVYQARPRVLHLFVMKNLKNLFLIGVLPLTIILFWGVEITSALLGEKWEAAGRFIQYLAPWALALFIINPLTYILNLLQKLRNELAYNTVLFLGRVGILVLAGLYLTAEQGVLFFALLSLAFNLGLIWYILMVSKLAATDSRP